MSKSTAHKAWREREKAKRDASPDRSMPLREALERARAAKAKKRSER